MALRAWVLRALVAAARTEACSESRPRERHRQRHRERRDQQRNALSHLFSPPLPFRQGENRHTSFTEIVGCATGSARLSFSAHLCREAGFLASI